MINLENGSTGITYLASGEIISELTKLAKVTMTDQGLLVQSNDNQVAGLIDLEGNFNEFEAAPTLSAISEEEAIIDESSESDSESSVDLSKPHYVKSKRLLIFPDHISRELGLARQVSLIDCDKSINKKVTPLNIEAFW